MLKQKKLCFISLILSISIFLNTIISTIAFAKGEVDSKSQNESILYESSEVVLGDSPNQSYSTAFTGNEDGDDSKSKSNLSESSEVVLGKSPSNVDTDALTLFSTEQKKITLDLSQIAGSQKNNVFFGNYPQSKKEGEENVFNNEPIEWRVLANKNGKLFLMANLALDVQQYHTSSAVTTWQKSTIRSWLNGLPGYESDNFLHNAFSIKEQDAIDLTNVDTGDCKATENKIFLLSFDEVNNKNYFPNDSSRIATNTEYVASKKEKLGVNQGDYWWLRSSINRFFKYYYVYLADVDGHGSSSYHDFDSSDNYYLVRPAFNLNLNSVLFTSDAVGGKEIPGDVGPGAIFEIPNSTSKEKKLTIKDEARNFNIINKTIKGNTLTIEYENAVTGPNEFISVIITDENGDAQYYGRLVDLSSSDDDGGIFTTKIPELLPGIYTFKFFNEQCNGDLLTDYSSDFQDVTLPLGSDSAPSSHSIQGIY